MNSNILKNTKQTVHTSQGFPQEIGWWLYVPPTLRI